MKKLKFICHDNKDDQLAQFTLMSVTGWFESITLLALIIALLIVWTSFDSERKLKDYLSSGWICLWITLIGSCGLIINALFFSVTAETLIVAAPIGIQLCTSYRLRGDDTTFLPWRKVKDFLILEVITCQKVIFVLALLTCGKDDDDKLVILFPETKPRLRHLEEIYRSSQRILAKNSTVVKSS